MIKTDNTRSTTTVSLIMAFTTSLSTVLEMETTSLSLTTSLLVKSLNLLTIVVMTLMKQTKGTTGSRSVFRVLSKTGG